MLWDNLALPSPQGQSVGARLGTTTCLPVLAAQLQSRSHCSTCHVLTFSQWARLALATAGLSRQASLEKQCLRRAGQARHEDEHPVKHPMMHPVHLVGV